MTATSVNGPLRYRLDRGCEPCIRLEDTLAELGVSCYGYADTETMDLITGRKLDEDDLDWLRTDDDQRTLHVVDPADGSTLALFRPYWWGDGDDPESDEPNMEVPSIGFRLEWYKYAFRGAYCDIEPDTRLVDRIRGVLGPALEAAHAYTLHPREPKGPIEWTRSKGVGTDGSEYDRWDAAPEDGGWDRGVIKVVTDGSIDPEMDPASKGMYSVELRSRTDDHTFTVSTFDTLGEAERFAALRARVFVTADGRTADELYGHGR